MLGTMRTFAHRYSWTIAAIALAGGIVVTALVIAGGTSGDASPFTLSLLATLAGVVAGVPVALALSDRDREAVRNAAKVERQRRRAMVVDQIDQDLAAIYSELIGPDRHPRGWIVPFLGSGLWDALKAAGSLDLLDNPRLIREVSRAYDRVALTGMLEKHYWEILFNVSRGNAGQPSEAGADVPVLRQIIEQDERTAAAITYARQLIAEDRQRE